MRHECPRDHERRRGADARMRGALVRWDCGFMKNRPNQRPPRIVSRGASNSSFAERSPCRSGGIPAHSARCNRVPRRGLDCSSDRLRARPRDRCARAAAACGSGPTHRRARHVPRSARRVAPARRTQTAARPALHQQQHRHSHRKSRRCHPDAHRRGPDYPCLQRTVSDCRARVNRKAASIAKNGAVTVKHGLNKRHVDVRQGPLTG